MFLSLIIQMDVIVSIFWLPMFKDLVIFHILQLSWKSEWIFIFSTQLPTTSASQLQNAVLVLKDMRIKELLYENGSLSRGAREGLWAEALALWQQSGSVAVIFSSPCCHSIQTLSQLAPYTTLPSPTHQASGPMGQIVSGARKHAACPQRAPGFCLYCTAWLRCPALGSGH